MKPVVLVLAVGALLGLAALGKAHAAVPDPPKFTSIEGVLSTDEAKITSDFAQVTTDKVAGANGPKEPSCYNLTENVDSDVAAMGYFVVHNVINDRNNMQNTINVLRQDIVNFNRDIADFINDGVPRPSGATGAVLEITTRISNAIAAANNYISLMNAAVAEAYAMGNNMATGPCSGRGPGGPPSIQPIS